VFYSKTHNEILKKENGPKGKKISSLKKLIKLSIKKYFELLDLKVWVVEKGIIF
jgi:hypothetical protein